MRISRYIEKNSNSSIFQAVKPQIRTYFQPDGFTYSFQPDIPFDFSLAPPDLGRHYL